jgi:hypothetical protein
MKGQKISLTGGRLAWNVEEENGKRATSFIWLFWRSLFLRVYLHNPSCRTTRHTKIGSILVFMCRVVRHNFH